MACTCQHLQLSPFQIACLLHISYLVLREDVCRDARCNQAKSRVLTALKVGRHCPGKCWPVLARDLGLLPLWCRTAVGLVGGIADGGEPAATPRAMVGDRSQKALLNQEVLGTSGITL